MSVIQLTAQNFEEEVMQSTKPVLIDFWASWCGPCRAIAPVIEELANEVTTAKIAKVNVDEQDALAMRFGVMSIPTLLVIKNGQIAARSVGVQPKERLLAMLEA